MLGSMLHPIESTFLCWGINLSQEQFTEELQETGLW